MTGLIRTSRRLAVRGRLLLLLGLLVLVGRLGALAQAPTVLSAAPQAGPVSNLTQITVTFSKPVTGVDAADLRLNDLPASTLSGSGAVYTFGFPQPAYGTVQIAWDMKSGIADRANAANVFNPTGPGARWLYDLIDAAAPKVALLNPPANQTVRQLAQLEVVFDKPVRGVEAADLLIGGQPATNVTGVAAGPYVFEFAAVADGPVTLAWAATHAITDLAADAHPFVPGASWSYTVNSHLALPDVIINELLAGNLTGLTDEDGDRDDWIELYNRGSTSVSLKGWALTDDTRLPGQWVFPAMTLPAGRYLVVFASGKDRRPTVAGGKLHTNFKLSANGEYLGLLNAESPRRLISELAPQFPEQRPDNSYGLSAAGAWGYFAVPTPGGLNGASPITQMAVPVHFSAPRGFYARQFNLTLATETPGARIRYTIDGSVPTAQSGFAYTDPILISTTRVIRAVAFKDGWLPSRAVTQTYLYNLPAARRYLPAISLVTATNNLYGKTGIMESNPRNTIYHGIAWERPASVELIRPEDNGGFAVDAGLRIQGGGYIRSLWDYRSTQVPYNKYSFRLYFRGDYGPSELNYPLFFDSPVQSFQRVVLRAGMNDPTNPFIRDEFARRLEADTGQIAAHGTFVNLFINGVYKGYYNPTEHIDHDFMRTWNGGGPLWDIFAANGEVVDGDNLAWNQLTAYVRNNDLSVPARVLEIERQFDLVNFVDYLLPLIYGDTDDWPHNNWRAARERVPGSRIRFYAWDAEWSFGYNGASPSHNTIVNQLGTSSPPWGTPEIAQFFTKLRSSPEFRLLFADRVHKHFFNDGALTDLRVRARYDQITNLVRRTITGFDNSIASSWIQNRRRYLTNHFAQAGLLASSNAPVFSPFGGRLPRGGTVTLSAGTGTVYYTTTGADPRVRFTGEVAPDARSYDPRLPLALDASLQLRARTHWDTNWSALTEATYQVAEFGSPLRFSEIMYHPPGGDAYEFLELLNTSPVAVDLSGVSLQGVEFRFLERVWLAGGARVLLISDVNPTAFAQRYPGVAVAGQFHGHLDNGGERLALVDRQGRVITAVNYRDDRGWPVGADGGGYSLELLAPDGDPDDPANWQASAQPGGSPGAPGAVPATPAVRLNEVMAENRTAVPLNGEYPDWVELYNAGAAAANLTGWGLSDDGTPRKFMFPTDTAIPAGGYLVVWCDRQPNAAELHASFALERKGGSVFLYDPLGRRADAMSYGWQAADYSVGRVGPAPGEWRLTKPTPGGANEAAQVAALTNIVVNEVLPNPVPGANGWLELFNRDPHAPASLRGLYLGTGNALFQMTSLAFVPANGFVVWQADAQPGPSHAGFLLATNRGTVLLYDHAGNELSRLAYTNTLEGVSVGLLPDGGPATANFVNSASPGAPNYLLPYVGPVLNEFLTRAEGGATSGAAGWVELFNPTTNALSLAGASLSLNPRQPGQWTFPAGVLLGAQGFLVVRCDETQPASTTNEPSLNSGWALPTNGGSLRLFNQLGQVVDVVEFGFQLPGGAVGRWGMNWALLRQPTAGAENAEPAPLGDPANLRLNEWQASGAGSDWLELYNRDPLPVNMAGLMLTDDPSLAGQTNHLVRPLTFVPGLGRVTFVADADPAEGAEHLRFKLDALGETIRLYDSVFSIIDSVDCPALPARISQGRFPDGGTNLVSFPLTPSRDAANYLPLGNIGVSEVLVAAESPWEQAIELFNLSPDPVAIGGWFLSDGPTDLKKFRIPEGMILPGGGYGVFYANQFSPAPGVPGGFRLEPVLGGQVILTPADASTGFAGYRAEVSFGAAELGVSFGRYRTTVGSDFVALSRPTFGVDEPHALAEFRQGKGAPNAYPSVGPVVINEIMYFPVHRVGPTVVEDPDLQFIEVVNPTATAAPLFDPEHPTNTWRLDGAVEFRFPAGITLAPGATLLVAGFDPAADAVTRAAFTRRYGLEAAAPLFGPWRGRLPRGGGSVRLFRPAAPQPGSPTSPAFVPEVLVERIDYGSESPWPPEAGGAGASLQRLAALSYGNEPLNWKAALPTAGRGNDQPVTLDTDGDGLSDNWETLHGLNPNSASGLDGAAGDPDGDGLSNLDEFHARTDPRQPTVLILRTQFRSDGFHLVFNGILGRRYTIEHRDAVGAGGWQTFADLLPLSATGPAEVILRPPPGSRARFYRLLLAPTP